MKSNKMITSINNIEILDCTLRDGGYYTNWDFSDELVDLYLDSLNSLPIQYIEIGYRSTPKVEYAGAYYYLPEYLIKSIKNKTNKALVIILDEKNISENNLEELLTPCIGKVELIRLAVVPENLERAISLVLQIKNYGFKVALNLMYASSWRPDIYQKLNVDLINNNLDFFYVVDSYGGLYPDDVKLIFEKLKEILKIPLGFHGHNNLEFAAINTLTAIENGASIVDATITGMGRGAGNLKTELLLSILHKKDKVNVDFDVLDEIVNSFTILKDNFKWGTNLSYMVSGAFSLPQSTVISKLKKRYYSLNTIIEDSNIYEKKNSEAINLPEFIPEINIETILIIGGGITPYRYDKALMNFLKKRPQICLIYASSKNVSVFYDLPNLQIHCLPGKELKRLEKEVSLSDFTKRYFIYPIDGYKDYQVKNSRYMESSYLLAKNSFFSEFPESVTAMAFEICNKLNVRNIYITGYDGYNEKITKEQKELFIENQLIFDKATMGDFNLRSLTPTSYIITIESVFSLI